jgi:hypothetical protein
MSDSSEPTVALPRGGGQEPVRGVPQPGGPAEPTVDLGRTVGVGETVDAGLTVDMGATVDLGQTVAPTGAARVTAVGGAGAARTMVDDVGGAVAGEVRFGPGVPAVAAPAAPAWREPAPVRRRPVWRRVVSALSTLLTVALLVVVGLFVWQRLSPLELEGVVVEVTRPAGQRCDVTVEVVATVRTNGNAGTIRYQWLRSGAAPGALLSERVGRGQRVVTLPLEWSFTGVGTARETATVNIVEPSVAQASAEVRYECRGR